MDKFVIVSVIPGRIRGGIAHPRAAEHALGALSREQLAEIAADPTLTIVRGELVTADTLGAFLDDADAARTAGVEESAAHTGRRGARERLKAS